MTIMLDAALDYAATGLPVFPLRGKLPLIAKRDGGRGVHDATTDTDRVRAWWDRWPNANIAIAVGERAACWVLDVDPRHDGNAALADLEAEYGTLPTTRTQITGGGGRHLLFRHDPAVHNGANAIAPGVDTKSTGGYVVAPPSIHPDTGRRYQWIDPVAEIAEAPPWLLHLAACGAEPELPQELERPRQLPQARDCEPYARAALERELEAVAASGPGCRNSQLNASSFALGQLVGSGVLPAEGVIAALHAVASSIGLRDREIVPTVRSGMRAGIAQPREVRL